MAINDLPPFMQRLRQTDSLSARALELLILTAARTSEVIEAEWGEFDLDERLWVLPAARMKAKRPHRVPLSDAAMAIVQKLDTVRVSRFVFPGMKFDNPLSNMAMLELLRGMQVDATAHGFRSSFRDWAAERTSFSGDLAEAALAHIVKNKVEAAYRRGDMVDKRRELMDAWAAYCAGQGP